MFIYIKEADKIDDLISPTLYDRENNLIAYRANKDDNYYFKTTKDDVSEQFIDMLIASEDKRFNYHLGVDFIALSRAFYQNIKHNTIVSGGSTIAMQTAKMLLKHKRTYKAKFKEILLATALTLYYGRDKVISMYLTLSPYGGSINSTKAASYFLFKKNPKNLTLSEIALLVSIPKHPNKISIIYKDNAHRAFLYKSKVLKSAYINNVISYKAYTSALDERVFSLNCRPFKRCLYPQKAYYLGQFVFSQNKASENYSYIDPHIQDAILDESKKFKALNGSDINVAMVALDNTKHELVGYLGGVHNEAFYVDAALAQRSTASTLKPFIYGKAFDRGIILPHSIIEDYKITINTWAPRNYDKHYRGEITAHKALINSLNVPAVLLLSKLDSNKFVFDFNKNYNFLKCRDDSLTTALGSCSISLLSLSSLYTIFSDEGIYNSQKVFYIKKNGKKEIFYNTNSVELKYRYLKKDSANAILHILKDTARPHNFSYFNDLSYKTGTSFNSNDAYALGFKNNITLGVLALKERASNIKITGYTTAAPVLFNVFENIDLKDDARDRDSKLLKVKYQNSLDKFYAEDVRYLSLLNKDKIKIVSPANNSLVIASDNRVFIEYKGGTLNKKLYVNDVLQKNSNYFYIEEDGQYNISVIDDDLNSDKITIFIRSN